MQVANIIAIRATISELSQKHKQGVDDGHGNQQLDQSSNLKTHLHDHRICTCSWTPSMDPKVLALERLQEINYSNMYVP